MKQNLHTPPYVEGIFRSETRPEDKASGTFLISKFARHLPLPRDKEIADWFLGKQTRRVSIQVPNSVISKIRSYKYSKDRPENFFFV